MNKNPNPQSEELVGPTKLVDLFHSSYDANVGSPPGDIDPRTLPPGKPGFLGNPFTEGTAEENLAAYRKYFLKRVLTDRCFKLAVLSLYGGRLGCICSLNQWCHAHVIVEWLHGQRKAYIQYFEPPIYPQRVH